MGNLVNDADEILKREKNIAVTSVKTYFGEFGHQIAVDKLLEIVKKSHVAIPTVMIVGHKHRNIELETIQWEAPKDIPTPSNNRYIMGVDPYKEGEGSSIGISYNVTKDKLKEVVVEVSSEKEFNRKQTRDIMFTKANKSKKQIKE